MDAWLEYLDIVQHPFLERFTNDYAVEMIYEYAVRGYPHGVMHRPEHWYGRATNPQVALDRMTEMIMARMASADEKFEADLLRLLEECEEPESIDLIQKIQNHFREERDAAGLHPNDLPSQKQRDYLRRLGVKEFSGTRGEASRLIDELKTSRS